jgi:hypothetical protein
VKDNVEVARVVCYMIWQGPEMMCESSDQGSTIENEVVGREWVVILWVASAEVGHQLV